MSPVNALGPILQSSIISINLTISELPLASKLFKLSPPGVLLLASKTGLAGVEMLPSLKATSAGIVKFVVEFVISLLQASVKFLSNLTCPKSIDVS